MEYMITLQAGNYFNNVVGALPPSAWLQKQRLLGASW